MLYRGMGRAALDAAYDNGASSRHDGLVRFKTTV